MNYKGYIGQVEYDDEARIFHGRVVGLSKAGINFQGRTVEELEKAFRDSVDDYIEWCEERGKAPERSFSGNLRLRLDPGLHARLSNEAARKKTSLNSLIVEKLNRD